MLGFQKTIELLLVEGNKDMFSKSFFVEVKKSKNDI